MLQVPRRPRPREVIIIVELNIKKQSILYGLTPKEQGQLEAVVNGTGDFDLDKYSAFWQSRLMYYISAIATEVPGISLTNEEPGKISAVDRQFLLEIREALKQLVQQVTDISRDLNTLVLIRKSREAGWSDDQRQVLGRWMVDLGMDEVSNGPEYPEPAVDGVSMNKASDSNSDEDGGDSDTDDESESSDQTGQAQTAVSTPEMTTDIDDSDGSDTDDNTDTDDSDDNGSHSGNSQDPELDF